MFSRHPASDSSKLHQFVSFDVWVMFLYVFKASLLHGIRYAKLFEAAKSMFKS